VARLVAAVHVGRVDPATLAWGYDISPKQLDRAAILGELRRGGDLRHALAILEPPFPHYARARRALARYKAAAAQGEPEPVPELPKGQRKVEPGKPWAGVPQLAARLTVMGDLPGSALSEAASDGAPAYDGPLVDAVKAFQARHGLDPDGVIGKGTIQALNATLKQRVRQIELAMERMRWLPKISDQATVFVNIALFRLWATDPASGQEPVRMNVVVGKSLQHKTPIFVDRMQYVVFRPYWNPPYGITVKEIVPHARRDPGYVARENLEIVASGDDDAAPLPVTPENLDKVVAGTLFVRQKPGPKNSLGLAKFIFPNTESIYMHGTPAQGLFSRARRDFSHGCIRLEDPLRLAQFVLRDQPDWTRERIEAAMQGERPMRVNLKQPLTVVLFYDTVHVNSEGVVFFVEDIYGDDRQLDGALAQGYPYPTRS
jgi:murein L,D-transpeptidase YcbB/YkuD